MMTTAMPKHKYKGGGKGEAHWVNCYQCGTRYSTCGGRGYCSKECLDLSKQEYNDFRLARSRYRKVVAQSRRKSKKK